ncbi:Spy/CpxP family protein refolding chaperone [Rubinisphaera margarita]|uniref:Spy/CpxP family protein refolding chaperone n=1 Tax=Rubinisphaera margarita TaxID=2909586 RepID=UPI001EE8D8B1|nr:hypothetical protein [Rubinisphaera margarita]MCG6156345.1 hypothetical protein [Rubinisphaera margarita]
MTRFFGLLLLVTLLWMGPSIAAGQENSGQSSSATLAESLPPKIQQIQKEFPAWLQKTDNKEAAGLMQKLGEQMKAKKFEEAEKTADSILKIMGVNAPPAGPNGANKSATSPAASSSEETTERLTAKVERIKAGTQKWAANGRDPAEIAKTMHEKFQPLMQSGRIIEAEAVLDNLLKQLGMDESTSAATPADEASAEERTLTRVHAIQKALPGWGEKTGRKEESDAMMQILREQLADMNFVEAEKTADKILAMLGVSIAPVAQAERPATAGEPKQSDDPFSTFIPQKLVLLASDRISLTPKQREVLFAQLDSTRARLEELTAARERESTALLALTSQDRLDEKAVLAQFDRQLDVEREAKLLQVAQGIMIQNLLTAEQRAMLREMMKNPVAVTKLEQEFKNRISAKVERVQAGAQMWARGGRDPSSIAEAMEQNVRPLLDSGRVFEAEAELDRVLELINKDSK